MARFYKTSSSRPLDYMFRQNTQLMADVIQANDAYITQNLQQTEQLGNAATTFPYLEDDSERARQISQNYSRHIDGITEAIRKDPANWRKQLAPIADVRKQLQADFKTGEISKISENYGKFKKVSDYIDEQVKQYNKDGKGISADRGEAYKKMFLKNFRDANGGKGTAYNSGSGTYNAISTFNPMNNIDIRKSLSEEMDKMKADGTIRITDEVSGSGEYFNKTTNKWEGITPDRILRIATDRLNNPQLMDYMRQDTIAGIITGVYDTDPNSQNYGKFIAPYAYNKIAPNTSEQSLINQMQAKINATKNSAAKKTYQDQLDAYKQNLDQRTQLEWNPNSYLAPILRGITDQYSYQKTETGNDLTNNSAWNTRYTAGAAAARQQAGFAHADLAQQRNFDHQIKMQEDRQEFDRQKELLKGSKAAAGKTPAGAKNNTSNSVVGVIQSTPFAWQTSNKDGMALSLNRDIDVAQIKLKQDQAALDNIRKANPDNKILIANAENQVARGQANLNSLEGQRNDAVNYAIPGWKANTKASIPYNEVNESLVRTYLSGSSRKEYEAATTELQKVEAKKREYEKAGNREVGVRGIAEDSQAYVNFMRNVYHPIKTRHAEAERKYTTGQKIFDTQIKGAANSKLERAAKSTTNTAQIISTTNAQDDRLVEMILGNKSAYKVIDPSTGKETGLSFDQGTAVTDKGQFKINGAGITTGAGNSVNGKNVELAVTINGKDYIVTPKEDGGIMGNYLADEFSKSTDPKVKNVGRILGSPIAGTIADMTTEMRMNTQPAFGTKDAWVYRLIPNPANPAETIRLRSRSVNVGGGEPKWEFQVETENSQLLFKNPETRSSVISIGDGKYKGYVPLSSTKSSNGIYHNLEDVLSIFPSDQ